MSLIPAFEIGIWNAWIFMIVFIIQMIVIMFVDKKTWEKSHVPIKAKRNRYEKYVGISANFFWLIAMIYSIILPLKLNTIWFYIGLLIFIIGLVIFIKATYDFITTNALVTLGFELSNYNMSIGSFADLVILNGVTDVWEAIRTLPQSRTTIKNGKILSESKYSVSRYY